MSVSCNINIYYSHIPKRLQSAETLEISLEAGAAANEADAFTNVKTFEMSKMIPVSNNMAVKSDY
jgi:hypothetical protein